MGRKNELKKLFITLYKQRYLHFLAIPAFIWMIVFCYIPMYGIQIAFKDFTFKEGIFGSPWVGFKYFQEFLSEKGIWDALKNTVGISLLKLSFMFPIPIILALLLNEITYHTRLKRIIQTVSYFPYFISWVIVAVMASSWLSPSTGFVNSFLISTGIIKEPYMFLGEPKAFWWIAVGLEVWKSTGWSSIIYLAAISSVDQEMYESAFIDGAGRFQRMWHITFKSILGTVMILLIINISSLLSGANFEVSYLLGNPLNHARSEILDTYILRSGITMGRYSYATAIGFLYGAVSCLMLFTANFISRKLTDESFF